MVIIIIEGCCIGNSSLLHPAHTTIRHTKKTKDAAARCFGRVDIRHDFRGSEAYVLRHSLAKLYALIVVVLHDVGVHQVHGVSHHL